MELAINKWNLFAALYAREINVHNGSFERTCAAIRFWNKSPSAVIHFPRSIATRKSRQIGHRSRPLFPGATWTPEKSRGKSAAASLRQLFSAAFLHFPQVASSLSSRNYCRRSRSGPKISRFRESSAIDQLIYAQSGAARTFALRHELRRCARKATFGRAAFAERNFLYF